MSEQNPKLRFIKTIHQSQKRSTQDINTEAKGLIQDIKRHPKNYYTVKDIEDALESFKNKAIQINQESHVEFSKFGMKEGIPSGEDSASSFELITISNENKELKKEVEQLGNMKKRVAELERLLNQEKSKINRIRTDQEVSQSEATTELESQMNLLNDQFQKLQEEKLTFSQQLDEVKYARDTAKKQLIDSNNAKDEIEKKIQEHIITINKLQESCDDLEREKKKSKQDIEKMESNFEQVGNSLMAARMEIESLQTGLAERDVQINNLNYDNNQLKTSLANNEECENRIKKIKDQSTTLIKKLESTMDERQKEYDEKIKNLQETNEKSELTQRNDKDLIREMQDKILKRQEENDLLALDLGETSHLAQQIKNELDELKQKLDSEVESNERLQKHIIQLELDKEKLSTKVGSDIEDIPKFNERIKDLQTTLDEKDQRIKVLESERNALNDQLKSIRNEKNQSQTDKEDLQDEIESKIKLVESLEEDRNKIKNDILQERRSKEKLELDFRSMKSDLNSLNVQLEERTKDYESLLRKNEELTKVADETRAERGAAEREKDLIEYKIRTLENQIKEIKDSKDKVDKRIYEIQAENDELSLSKDSANRKLNRLNEKNVSMTQAIEKLKSRLAENPKYGILFILQDVQEATLSEITKIVTVQKVFALRLARELEQEGWIELDEINEKLTLKKSFIEL